MLKIPKEMKMKIVKMAKNMIQLAIVKELRILRRSSISEIVLKFQGAGSVSDRPKCVVLKSCSTGFMETN